MKSYHSPQVDVRVRLNTNESPDAPDSDEFSGALAERLAGIDWNRYPARSAERLRTGIGELHGTSVDNVFAANGSNEVIQTLLLTYAAGGGRVGLFTPTYALHSHIARIAGAEVVAAPRGEDFAIGAQAAARFAETERPDVLFLCSPNNPTGTVEDPGTLRAVLDVVSGYGGLVVVDEAYIQFTAAGPGGMTAVDLLGETTPLVVCRTFSKAWALAAARIGYALGPAAVVAELHKVVLPYHLGVVTQEVGLACLSATDAADRRAAATVAERERLAEALGALAVRQWPSGANFILFRPTARSGAEVWQGLLERSVLVRDCSSWEGLEGCLRVTVGTPGENSLFLEALQDVLG
jgi:histidinol-phosphate aminotransferase